MEEDGGAILRAPVRPLAVQGGWIVEGKKRVQKLLVTHFLRVEVEFHNFGVSSLVGTDVPVRGPVELATLIAHGSRGDSRNCCESRLEIGRAAWRKRGEVCVGGGA